MTISDLPSFIKCANCKQKHFLHLNKDINGNWTMAYVEFENNTAILPLNNSSSLLEAATRMHYALERYNKANGQLAT